MLRCMTTHPIGITPLCIITSRQLYSQGDVTSLALATLSSSRVSSIEEWRCGEIIWTHQQNSEEERERERNTRPFEEEVQARSVPSVAVD